jgi:hypothetical protein
MGMGFPIHMIRENTNKDRDFCATALSPAGRGMKYRARKATTASTRLSHCPFFMGFAAITISSSKRCLGSSFKIF